MTLIYGLLHRADRGSEVLTALKALAGVDTDPTHECPRAVNRFRGLLLHIFPGRGKQTVTAAGMAAETVTDSLHTPPSRKPGTTLDSARRNFRYSSWTR
jgi:hypothetical protein